jgi:excinuclease ABC subunit C
MQLGSEINSFDHKAFLKTLTHSPGIYRMLDGSDQVLYVGKAKDLKRRVSSYFTRSQNRRIQLLVSKIRSIETTVTHTEAEALILENNLIKSLRPKYNILLKDDKSYPYIYLSADPFPRLAFHRGAKKAKGQYFGPYPNAGSLRETMQLLQKLFPVRQCEESFYRNRSRPCLQYQIKRCTAPCVDLISEEDYSQDVGDAILFLQGKASKVIDDLVVRMEQASTKLEFEQAVRFRDQIARLRKIQKKQYVSGERGDLDIAACVVGAGVAVVQLFIVRGGRNLGNKVFHLNCREGQGEKEILSAFLCQHYIGKQIPREIIVSSEIDELNLIQEVLSTDSGHRVKINQSVRSDKARWLKMALHNAKISLDAKLASRAGYESRLEALQSAFNLEEVPQRMECFDISHTSGEETIASCVVFDQQGAAKHDYRRFNIKDIQPGDDYAAMDQALMRRYKRIQSGEGKLPDILFIDGGKGQLAAAERVLNELAVTGVILIGIAKGRERKAGLEKMFVAGQDGAVTLPADSPAIHLIQQIRDEAHRFAITGHRQRREKSGRSSILEEIEGVGPKRRQRLLKQFGGLQELQSAGVEDLQRVEGISRKLAEKIYDCFHGDS